MARPARIQAGSQDRALRQILDELDGMADALAEQMLQRYLETIPSYRALPDETLRQIRAVNQHNIRSFVRALRESRGPSPDELELIRESASKRAREGVPLSGLLAAYRQGAQIAWSQARELIGDNPERLKSGLDFATAVMRWVDEASGAAAQSYLAEYERVASDRESARRDFLDGLLSAALTPDEIVARGEALGLDSAAPHSIAIVRVEAKSTEDVALRGAVRRLRTMTAELPFADQSLVVARSDEIVIVFPAAAKGEDQMTTRLRAFVGIAGEAIEARVDGGIGRPRETLSELAPSYREASIALSAASAGASPSVALYGEVLVEELLLRERGVARRLSHTVLDPLVPHPELRATLVEYLRHGPSLPAVAQRLFLHPNTVAYRLARIKELTGRDPKTPAGVAELFLALRAAQLVGDEGPRP
jgi:hypothetical protein